MTKVDLITGFLGAGKTTFLKLYVNYLLSKGEKICILEFDYGAVNVDMMLLQEFNDKCDIEMVAGGCDYDCHLRRFKTKLIAMGMKKYDRVIIEPSGIFDTDEFFDTIYDEPLDNWYEIGSVITIVDPKSINLSAESESIYVSELAPSGAIVLSKTQKYNEKVINEALNYLDNISKKYGINIISKKVITKPFFDFNDKDFNTLLNAGYRESSIQKSDTILNNSYSSLYILNTKLNLMSVQEKAFTLLGNESYGHIIRIKGFINDNNKWYEVNFTNEEQNINPLANGQDVIIIIGENLKENEIKKYIETDFINI